MKLQSHSVAVSKNPEELYNFLTNVENFERLMPENIQKFEKIGEDKFVFALKGMPEIYLQMDESTPHSEVVLKAASDKIPFKLKCDIQPRDTGSEAQLHFEGKFNTMMGMMIKSPIQNFINQLADGLSKL